MIDDLIEQAGRLARAGSSKPRQADLRRSVSTAYYALFHAMAKTIADTVAGTAKAARSDQVWALAYRGIQHGEARAVCEILRKQAIPSGIRDCADAFVELQPARQSADYDPLHRLTRERTLELVQRAREAIGKLRSASAQDRRAFAVQILVRKRGQG